MRRLIRLRMPVCAAAALAFAGLLATPAATSAQPMINFHVGAFIPAGTQSSSGLVTGRPFDDVIVKDSDFLDFEFKNFNGPTVGAELLVPLGDLFDAGLGIGFYQRTVLSADAFSEFAGTGNPILADLKLRMVPFNATFRWLPLGHHDAFTPYIGAGVGVFAWQYHETGNFVAGDNVTIVSGDFKGSGSASGPVILGGVRVPVGAWAVGGEIKWQKAEGTLPSNQSFAGSTIGLGGTSYAFTFGVRF